MEETVSVRIPSDLLEDLSRLTQTAHQSRSDLLREILQIGLGTKRLQLALEAYRQRRVSLGKAHELAGVPLSIFLDELKRAGILLHSDLDELKKDLEWARRD